MSTGKTGLTNVLISNLKPKLKQYERFDGKIPGFGLRVSPGGTKSFILVYRVGTEARRLTLGRYPTLKLADARTKALKPCRHPLMVVIPPQTSNSGEKTIKR